MTGYTVIIDTGGTKTRLCVFDNVENLVFEASFKGVGAYYDCDLGDFVTAIRSCGEIPFENTERVVCNVGGKNDGQIRAALTELFCNARVEVFRESSGVIMRSICLMNDSDAILMAGTGSIALAIGSRGSIIADGWSPNSGDKGSGYWIGLEAISRSLIALEGDSLPPLARCVTKREEPFFAVSDTQIQMVERDKVREGIFPLERERVAAYTKVAAEYARGGDSFAKEIFEDAGVLLAKTVLRAVKRAECKGPTRIFVSGGLTRCIDLWGDAFRQTLAEDIEFTLAVGEADMIKGALYLAVRESN